MHIKLIMEHILLNIYIKHVQENEKSSLCGRIKNFNMERVNQRAKEVNETCVKLVLSYFLSTMSKKSCLWNTGSGSLILFCEVSLDTLSESEKQKMFVLHDFHFRSHKFQSDINRRKFWGFLPFATSKFLVIVSSLKQYSQPNDQISFISF